MVNRRGFAQKGKLSALAAHVTKTFTAPTSGLEGVYFTWDTVRDAVRYTKVVDKLKEYVVVHFHNQATVAVRVMEELKAPIFTKKERPVRMYWFGTSREAGGSKETKTKRNPDTVTDYKAVRMDWEHKFEVWEYVEGYKTHKEDTQVSIQNKGKCYYLVLQYCPPELKTELKNSAR